MIQCTNESLAVKYKNTDLIPEINEVFLQLFKNVLNIMWIVETFFIY